MIRYRYFLLSSVLQFPYSFNVQQYRFFFPPKPSALPPLCPLHIKYCRRPWASAITELRTPSSVLVISQCDVRACVHFTRLLYSLVNFCLFTHYITPVGGRITERVRPSSPPGLEVIKRRNQNNIVYYISEL